MKQEELITSGPASRLLGVSQPTLAALVDRGELAAVLITRETSGKKQRVFRVGDVEALAKKRAGEKI